MKNRHVGALGYVFVPTPPDQTLTATGYSYEHVSIAEKALGKPLPSSARVHHADEDKANNANNNLVICQDDAYHFLLHARKRALLACGNPNWLPCFVCKEYADPGILIKANGQGTAHCHPFCRKKFVNLQYKKKVGREVKPWKTPIPTQEEFVILLASRKFPWFRCGHDFAPENIYTVQNQIFCRACRATRSKGRFNRAITQ
jgi:hypothetical protein